MKAGLNLSWFDCFEQNFAILEPDILLVLYADILGVNDTNMINISEMNPENLIFSYFSEFFRGIDNIEKACLYARIKKFTLDSIRYFINIQGVNFSIMTS